MLHGEVVAAKWAVPNSHVVDKNLEGYFGSEAFSAPSQNGTAQDSSAMKINPYNF